MFRILGRRTATGSTPGKVIQEFHPSRLGDVGKLRLGVVASLACLFFIGLYLAPALADGVGGTAAAPITLAQQSAPVGDRPGRPPQEAIAACENKPAEAACSFEALGGQQITGTCRAPDDRAPAACAPANMPRNG